MPNQQHHNDATEMEYERVVHPEIRVVELVVHGEIDLSTLAAAGKECRLYALQHNFGFLSNTINAKGLPTAEAAESWFDDYYTGLEHSLKSVYTAHLTSDEYYETHMHIDQSWNSTKGTFVKAFRDREESLAWLKHSLES